MNLDEMLVAPSHRIDVQHIPVGVLEPDQLRAAGQVDVALQAADLGVVLERGRDYPSTTRCAGGPAVPSERLRLPRDELGEDLEEPRRAGRSARELPSDGTVGVVGIVGIDVVARRIREQLLRQRGVDRDAFLAAPA